MNVLFQNSPSNALTADVFPFTESSANSLLSQPEASAYFNLSCEEAICDRINRSVEELDLPDFFTH